MAAFTSGLLPPGPRAPGIVQTAMILRDPIGFLERCRALYGPVFRVSFVSFGQLVYVAEPKLARQVFASDRDVGHAGDVRREFLEPLVGANSVLCLEGDEWLRQRKLLAPAFHGRAVTAFRDEMASIAAEQIETWPVGEPFALRPRMQAITLEVILRLVFGIRDAARLEQLRSLLPPLMETGGSFFIWVLPAPIRERLERSPALQRLPGSPMRRFYRLRDRVDAIIRDEIARRRAGSDAERTDVLSMLLAARDEHDGAMTDQELRDELVTLLEAGHETTATALAWTFERLSRHPDIVERLRAELAEGREEYLDAVVKESLRSRPVVFDAPRRLSGELKLDGYRVPAGWYVAPAIPLVHRSPDAFPDPERFSPERFLGDEPATEGWIPFGGGKRRCLGSQLALVEMKTVIREVLGQLALDPVDPADEPARLRHVTLVPRDLTRVIARPAPVLESSRAASPAAAG